MWEVLNNMATITFTIPDEKLQRVIDSIGGLYPVPQIPDPEWVDPEDGSTIYHKCRLSI
jgi:hypothetical protein